jgi:hypothetical protein
MRSLVPRLCAVLAGCCALLFPSLASANIGPRWQGDPVVEPKGLKEVAIVHEDLTIDLRPLATMQPARVEVTYRLNNPKGPRALELVFVSGTEAVSDFEVRLGERQGVGRLLPTREVAKSSYNLPKSWLPPRKVPGISSEDAHYWMRPNASLLAFTVELPPGPSALTVRYRARAAGAQEDEPVTTWVFPYVLAPAREWGGFGSLDVTVHLPEGWEASSTPGLTREGDTLHGRFEGVPADHLIVATRAPLRARLCWARWLCRGLFVLSVVSGGALCWWVGRLMGRYLVRRQGPPSGRRAWAVLWAGLVVVLMALLWAAMILGGAVASRWGIYRALDGQEGPYFHHETHVEVALGTLCLMLVALPAGVVLTSLGMRRPQRPTQGGPARAEGMENGGDGGPTDARPDVPLWP